MHNIDNIRRQCKKRHMPPKIEPGTPTQRIQILAPHSWVERVDQWRRKQEGAIPSRSEAIRILVTMALAID